MCVPIRLLCNKKDLEDHYAGQIGSGLTHITRALIFKRALESEEYFVDCLGAAFTFSKRRHHSTQTRSFHNNCSIQHWKIQMEYFMKGNIRHSSYSCLRIQRIGDRHVPGVIVRCLYFCPRRPVSEWLDENPTAYHLTESSAPEDQPKRRSDAFIGQMVKNPEKLLSYGDISWAV
ncbi:hypothetical protein TNIN_182851 [Trichonephila inaurata madagascariensis]|uniref:Uncharacterized protein n=1 Tax=Trichonephila inaurata madagascariensis TaxID=2747483 RepID=A0A8X6XGF6_9ARAC|nr:hypothetical protein TNIN_182851 [Trichonephila inaurata madagascariensis]